jgi:methanogenic corrinoid protein MtbC1
MNRTVDKQEILQGLSEAVVEMDDQGVVDLCKEVLDKGIDVYTAISEGLTEGMKRAGQLYNEGQYFIPELILCSDVLYTGLDILTPHLRTSKKARKLKMIIGVVEGDVHDIGKNLVKAMFTAGGWEVDDLGSDVKLEVFGDEQKKEKANVVGLSALMTTSMLAIPTAIKILRRSEPVPFILVGGAPLSGQIAKQYQADGYAEDAVKATTVAEELLRDKPD